MSEVVFRPQSWTRSGDAFSQEGSDIAAKVAATLGRMNVDALGCTRGGHAADVALSLVVPPLLEVFTEAINGLAEGFGVTGEVLTASGVAYANTEEANTDAGNDAANA
jgi:hypothetical protein